MAIFFRAGLNTLEVFVFLNPSLCQEVWRWDQATASFSVIGCCMALTNWTPA